MGKSLVWEWTTGKRDDELPERYYELDFHERLIKGSLYDCLEYAFYQDFNSSNEYIPMRQRRPSTRKGLPKVVVHDSTSLLFSNTHFPSIQCSDKNVQSVLGDAVENLHMQTLMLTAARMGAVGSVAIELCVLDKQPIFNLLQTKYLTPYYHPKDPRKLIKVERKVRFKGHQLKEIDPIKYAKLKDSVSYWLCSEWDAKYTRDFTPLECGSEGGLVLDEEVLHGMGFVPIVWIKNLVNMDPNDIDGLSTIPLEGASLSIEIDYQTSQTGRALTYAADPITVIKKGEDEDPEDAEGFGPKRNVANVLEVAHGGDAKMLEISGEGPASVISYTDMLREAFMEVSRGNRASPDKLAAATSGYAIELMNAALITLAKELRVSYGDEGLLRLLRMLCDASKKISIEIEGVAFKCDLKAPLRLRWPPFYDPNATDRQQEGSTLVQLTNASLLPLEVAREHASIMYGVVAQDAIDKIPDTGYVGVPGGAVKTDGKPVTALDHKNNNPAAPPDPLPKKSK